MSLFEMNSTPPLAQLPPELLSQIFLDVDPHTLYTSIRCLSRQWKRQVEENLLKAEFNSSRWRVALRVTRKPKAGRPWRGGIVGHEGDQVPGAAWNRLRQEAEAAVDSEEDPREAIERARNEHTDVILSREGALEDELPSAIEQDALAPLFHIVPLQFKAYDATSSTLQFDTGSAAWHALFESTKEEEEEGGNGRLELDFSIVWRFPGDGQSDDMLDGWGIPDQENGWLSRFYCSNRDTSKAVLQEEQEGQQVFHSTPLARRTRKRQLTLQQESNHPELDRNARRLEWSDEGHEYFSLSLSLGTEFFVRRSARTNFLMRRLEAQAKADEEERVGDEEEEEHEHSLISTPRRTSPLMRSLADPMARVKGRGGRGYSSSSSTPTRIRGSRMSGPSYASVASTPASGCSSPRGSLISMRSSGPPRIVKVQSSLAEQGGSQAPFPSANVSGYSSVKHQARVNEKDSEAAVIAEALPSSSSSSSTTTTTRSVIDYNSASRSQRGGQGLSGHCSVPRAHFSAHLFKSIWGAPPPQWTTIEEGSSHSPFRSTPPPPIGTPITVWEWTR